MSRVAKVPVNIPEGVQVTLERDEIRIKGKLGELSQRINSDLIDVKQEEGKLSFAVKNDSKLAKALSGTMRSLVNNMVQGVTTGYERKLTLIGVGYKAAVQGRVLNLSLGYSHPIDFQLPEGINASVEQGKDLTVTISGSDKQAVGQVAAKIRHLRPPEPYKGKGVRYADENVQIKEVKKKK